MIKVAVVGLGYWGPNLVRNFYQCPNANLIAVCDSLPAKLKAIQRTYSDIGYFFTDFEDILKLPIDLVAIVTPPETHFLLAKACLESGKHILVEKPVTTSLKEAEYLCNLSEKLGLSVFVDHTFIFHPVVRKIKDIIERGELGEVLYFDSERINLGLLQRDVNVIWDLAVHDISIFMYLLNYPNVKKVNWFGYKHIHHTHEDMAHLVMETDTGVVGHIHVSWLSPVKIRKTIIGGTEKMIWWDDVHPFEKLKLYDSKVKLNRTEDNPFFPTYVSGDVTIVKVENKEPLAIEVASIVDCLENNREPVVGIKQALAVMRILEALK